MNREGVIPAMLKFVAVSFHVCRPILHDIRLSPLTMLPSPM